MSLDQFSKTVVPLSVLTDEETFIILKCLTCEVKPPPPFSSIKRKLILESNQSPPRHASTPQATLPSDFKDCFNLLAPLALTWVNVLAVIVYLLHYVCVAGSYLLYLFNIIVDGFIKFYDVFHRVGFIQFCLNVHSYILMFR